MGWTFYNSNYYTKSGAVDRKKECDSMINAENDKRKQTVLKSKMVGSTYYAAVEDVQKETNERKVFAVVILTSSDKASGYNFGYKDLDEFMGPCESKYPNSILDLLSPTDHKWALAWRERCRKYNGVKPLSALPIGTMIQYTRGEGEVRRLIKRPPNYQFKRAWWYCPDDNTYSSPKYIPMDYEVVKGNA